jgi:glutathione synthase/RimK-type ligase-like ATP-grasp enzyme
VRIALATASNVVGLDEDEPALLEALAAHGVEAEVAAWDDPAVEWAGYDLVVVRSTWNYHLQRDAFLAWVDRLPAVANPAEILRWNTDKRYLRDLEAAGVPVVPTAWLEPGDRPALPDWEELVVKPAVSAGSLRTGRYGADDHDAAVCHAEELLAEGRTVMVQPYLAEIDEAGETALVVIGGEHSHAIRKGPILRWGGAMFEGPYADEDISPRRATPAERELADAALAAVPGGPDRLLYARVDVVADDTGSPVVLELELTEPSLFLTFADDADDADDDGDDGAAGRLASAIAAWTR